MANFRNGNLVVGQTLGATFTTVQLSANNQTVSPGSNQVILLQSDSATASSRIFNIQSSTITGQQISIIFESESPLACELLSTPGVGNVRIVGLWSPMQYDILTLTWDGQFWVESSRSNISSGPSPFNPVITSPADAQVLIYDSLDADWENKSISGDATITNAGVLTIASGAVTSAKIANATIVAADISATADIIGTQLAPNASIQLTQLQLINPGDILFGGPTVGFVTSGQMSGDAGVSNAGVLTIAKGAVTSEKIANATIVAADISDTAAIAYSQLEALPAGEILVGSDVDVATAVEMTGAVTISNTGVTSISAGAVTVAKCDPTVIAQTQVTLTNSQILALDSSAIVLVTGVTGSSILVESVQINFANIGGTGYTTAGGIQFGYATGTAVMVFNPTVIAGSVSLYYFGIPGTCYTVGTTGTETGLNFNASFQSSFVISSIGAVTGGASGNTLTITTTYRTIYQ